MLIFLTVGKKHMANPNTHATLLGLIWACIQFRWNIKFPAIIEKSIADLSSGGLGMAMFSLGTISTVSLSNKIVHPVLKKGDYLNHQAEGIEVHYTMNNILTSILTLAAVN
ncbi:hypothetical protein REPUB_Repub09cG0039100 [Reevesia pubescens]